MYAGPVHAYIKQRVRENCPVADVGKFRQKAAMRSARSTLKLGKMGLCSPFQPLLSRYFAKIMIRPNLSKKMPFPQTMYFTTSSAIYLMSFGSLGWTCFFAVSAFSGFRAFCLFVCFPVFGRATPPSFVFPAPLANDCLVEIPTC